MPRERRGEKARRATGRRQQKRRCLRKDIGDGERDKESETKTPTGVNRDEEKNPNNVFLKRGKSIMSQVEEYGYASQQGRSDSTQTPEGEDPSDVDER